MANLQELSGELANVESVGDVATASVSTPRLPLLSAPAAADLAERGTFACTSRKTAPAWKWANSNRAGLDSYKPVTIYQWKKASERYFANQSTSMRLLPKSGMR